MTPERAFMLWMNDHLYMVVKRYRPEVRAHALKALKSGAKAGEAQRAETPKGGSVHEHAVGSADAPKT